MKGLLDVPTARASRRDTINFQLISGLMLMLFSVLGILKCTAHYLEVKSEEHQQIMSLLAEDELLPLRPSNYGAFSNSAKKIFFDEDFKKKAIEIFSGSIQIETESYDYLPNPEHDIEPWIKFFKFHDHLEKSFPLVHKHLELEKPNKVSLVYTWKGSDPSLKPLLLTAHQDVVPVDPSSAGEWTYAPYSGHYDGKTVWGRGTIDCKNLLIGVLQSVETLISDGFKPRRTIVLAFGSDEEIDGNYGANYISKLLLERYGSDSFYALVDEGNAVISIDGEWYATPATSEKRDTQVTIKITTPGGHSSVPPDHTTIGIAAKLITSIEGDQFKPILSPKNPFLGLLQEVAKHSKNLPKSLKNDILRANIDPEANKRVVDYIVQTPSTKYLIQTSQAIDTIRGGVKSNALPETVEIVYDSRISVDQSVDDVFNHVLKHIKDIAKEFGLGVKLDSEVIEPITAKGYFTISYQDPKPLKVSPNHGDVWNVFVGTIKHVWDDVVFSKTNESIHVAPSLMVASTDTKHYMDLTPNIYRFFPSRIGNIDEAGIHSIDEHIGIENHLETIVFLYEFILNADEANDQDSDFIPEKNSKKHSNYF